MARKKKASKALRGPRTDHLPDAESCHPDPVAWGHFPRAALPAPQRLLNLAQTLPAWERMHSRHRHGIFQGGSLLLVWFFRSGLQASESAVFFELFPAVEVIK